jgi:hypothetical protein
MIKDLFQIAAWAVAIVGGLIAAFKAIAEWRKDLRWKQAEMAKTCLDEIRDSPLASAALKMLDWTGLSFGLPDGTNSLPIDHEQRRTALRIVNTVFPPGDPGPFIRDAFDALFDGFERLEHFIRIELIRFDDVEPPLRYYVSKLAAPEDRRIIEAFLNEYGFALASSFLDRFNSWKLSSQD